MTIWSIGAAVAALTFVCIWNAYRRQVKKICRRLEFLKQHDTNMRINLDLPLSETAALADHINELLNQMQESRKRALRKDIQLKSTLTYLSHDIRTPLTSLDGYFQLLAESESEEEQRHYKEIIRGRIDSLKAMLEELFMYAKLEDDDFELPLSEIDFSKCVHEAVFSFYEDLSRKGIEPAVDFCEGRLLTTGNEDALRRVMQNIIKNALVHGSREISMNLCRNNGEAVFTCVNGVSKENEMDTERVFERFYKADSARTQSSTGLGLSIAKDLVERMGGEILVSLLDGKFTVMVRMKTHLQPRELVKPGL